MLLYTLLATIIVAMGLYSIYAAYQCYAMDCDRTTWNKKLDRSHFQNRIIWITGASSGIGKSLAQYLSSLDIGVKLVLSARRENKLRQLKAEINHTNPTDVMILPLDVSNKEVSYYKIKYQSILKRFKVSSVDILINNAGVSMRSTFVDFDINDSIELFQTNLISPIILSKLVLTDMVKRGKNDSQRSFGHIVNISSLSARLLPGYRTTYASSKSGILAFGYSLSEEVKKYLNITVTDILPGNTQTNIDVASKGKYGKYHNEQDAVIQSGMSSDRCAELICVATSNRLRESWIARGDALLAAYICYHLPVLYEKHIRKVVSGKMRS